MDNRVADDILYTGGIAEEVYGADTLENRRKVRRRFAQGQLQGCWKERGLLRGSRDAIRAAYRRRAGLLGTFGEPAATSPQ